MGNEILIKSILTVIGFTITGALGYLVASIKEHKRQGDNEQKALKCLLRSAITKIYYKYTETGHIPRFEKENVTYLYTQYKAMGGNSYVDSIYPEIMKLPTKSE